MIHHLKLVRKMNLLHTYKRRILRKAKQLLMIVTEDQGISQNYPLSRKKKKVIDL